MITKHTLSLVTALSLSFAARAAEGLDLNPADWTIVAPPPATDWSARWQFHKTAAKSPRVWRVAREDKKVAASLKGAKPAPESARPPFDTSRETHGAVIPATSFLKVDDGWIVGHTTPDTAVYWYSEDGGEKKLLSDQHKIHFHLRDHPGNYALTSFRSRGVGSVVRFVKKADGWRIEHHCDLPGAPRAIAPLGAGKYLIVTHDMLLKVGLDKEIVVLVPAAEWGTLAPNSIAVDDDGFVYIGMRKYVARCKLGDSVVGYDYLLPGTRN